MRYRVVYDTNDIQKHKNIDGYDELIITIMYIKTKKYTLVKVVKL
jgi:hypothetical protein